MITFLFFLLLAAILHLSIAVVAYDTRQHRFTRMAYRYRLQPYESHYLG